MNHWNELVEITKDDFAQQTEYTTHDGKSYSWADMAKMDLSALNTASGFILKPGIEVFVNNFNHLKLTTTKN